MLLIYLFLVGNNKSGNRNDCRSKSDSFIDIIILGTTVNLFITRKKLATFFKAKIYDNFRQYVSDK